MKRMEVSFSKKLKWKGKIGASDPSMIKIGLLYDRIRVEEKEMIKAAGKIHIKLKPIDSKALYLNLSKGQERYNELFGDAVLQRCISYFRGLHTTAILESKGVPVVNSYHTTVTCGNKLLTTLVLTKAGIPTPETLISYTPTSTLDALEEVGYPAVLKPVTGSWGRLLALMRDRFSAQAIIESREEMSNPLLQIYYIQKWIRRPPRDIRVIVIDDEVIAASYRYAPQNDWRTNVARGGRSESCPVTPELEEIALEASKAVGGGVLAVDCMEEDGKILVHELNGGVEFKGLMKTTNVNIAQKIVEYAVKVVKR